MKKALLKSRNETKKFNIYGSTVQSNFRSICFKSNIQNI